MKKYLLVLLLAIFIIPSIAFASWWNPFSWFNGWAFHKQEIIPQPQIVNLQIDTPITKNLPIKEVEKNIPVTNNSTSQKLATQAKLDAELKAKDEQNALIAKQKAEEQTKIDAGLKAKAESDALITKQKADEQARQEEAQRIEQEKITQLNAETSRLNKLIQQRKDLLQEFNNKVSEINQQIIDIKNQYYIDFAGEANRAIPLNFVQARQQKLLDDANAKIAQLNLQIDQLRLDYNNKINQL